MIHKFILRTVQFSAILAVVILVAILVPQIFLKREAQFKLDEKVKYVVFGHSHSECAFDDSRISNFKNLSNAGQSYFYLLPKLRKVLDANPQVKTVFIEFSNGQIEERMDDWIWGHDKLHNFFPLYAPFLKYEEQRLLLDHNPSDLFSVIPIVAKNSLGRILAMDMQYGDDVGKFKPLEKSIVDSLINDYQHGIREKADSNPKISEVHLHFLDEMIAYCKKKGVRVVLVRSPQHRFYNYRANEQVFQKIRRERYGTLTFLDYNDFPLLDNQFGDFGHVNREGAEVFSDWFERNVIQDKKFIEKQS